MRAPPPAFSLPLVGETAVEVGIVGVTAVATEEGDCPMTPLPAFESPLLSTAAGRISAASSRCPGRAEEEGHGVSEAAEGLPWSELAEREAPSPEGATGRHALSV